MKQTMVYVGSLSTGPDRVGGWIRGFEALGWDVRPFSSEVAVPGPVLWGKIARRFSIGPTHRHMRQQLIKLCRQLKPAWVHFRLPLAFTRRDIAAIKATGAVVTEYFNDDPFSPQRVWGLHRRFLRAIPAFDAHFVYRSHNVPSFMQAGASHVEHCPPALDPIRFKGMSNIPLPDRYDFDASFIGHFEDDGRLAYLERLYEAGFTVAVHGSGWGQAIQSGPLSHLHPAAPVFGAAYGELYARSACGLCFFSKLNRDCWTERPLEIIAVGGLLVCERTDEAMAHFTDGEEAFFFSSPDELVDICARIKSDAALRRRVLQAGRRRLDTGEFDLQNRAVDISLFAQKHGGYRRVADAR